MLVLHELTIHENVVNVLKFVPFSIDNHECSICLFYTCWKKEKTVENYWKNHLWTSEPLIQELQLYHQINFKFWVLWTQAEINKPFINWRWHGTCCLLGHHTKKRRSTETCDFKINVRCIEHLDVILNIWYYDLQVLELPLTACQFQSLCFSFLKFK